MIDGDTAFARARLREPGWVVVSRPIATEHHVAVGGVLTLPTPSGPVGYRLAATTTNFGWTPGAIVMSSASYAAAWHTALPSALGVDLAPGAQPTAARGALAAALGPATALKC